MQWNYSGICAIVKTCTSTANISSVVMAQPWKCWTYFHVHLIVLSKWKVRLWKELHDEGKDGQGKWTKKFQGSLISGKRHITKGKHFRGDIPCKHETHRLYYSWKGVHKIRRFLGCLHYWPGIVSASCSK